MTESPCSDLPHITVSAIICDDRERYLLIEERVRDQLVLNQPAGHLDSGETLVEAVIRETFEESGWHFLPEALVGIYLYHSPFNQVTYQRVCFTGSVSGHEPDHPLDDGIERTLWLSYEELKQTQAQHRSSIVMRCIEDYQAGCRYPLSLLVNL